MIDPFLLPLLIKSLCTALVVVTASIAAERGGPFWGGIAVTLPVTAGPAYVMLALDQPARFIAASALASYAAYPATWVFLATVVLVAPRLAAIPTLTAALAAWLAATMMLQAWSWSFAGATFMNIGVYAIAAWLVRKPSTYLHAAKPLASWAELVGRALLVGAFIAGVVTISGAIGPAATGIGAVFPIAVSTLTLILHRKMGGEAVAATMQLAAHAVAGTGAALGILSLLVVELGVWTALAVSLGVALTWSAALSVSKSLSNTKGLGQAHRYPGQE